VTSRSPIPPPFNAAVEAAGEGVRVRFSGELDLATAPDAEATVAQARREQPGPVALDLSELTFLDSSGLRLVMEINRACDADGCRLTITPGPRNVQRVFDLAGVVGILPFES
jgi:anti-anti-sigma factor